MSLHSTRSNRSGRGVSFGAATDANVYQCVEAFGSLCFESWMSTS